MAGLLSCQSDVSSLGQYEKVVIEQLESLDTGIHMIQTGGPIYHVIMLKYTKEYYSAIISCYMGDLLYVQCDGSDPLIRAIH